MLNYKDIKENTIILSEDKIKKKTYRLVGYIKTDNIAEISKAINGVMLGRKDWSGAIEFVECEDYD